MGNYATQPDFATTAEAVTPSDAFSAATKLNGSALYVGVGGDISVIMYGVEPTAGNAVVFKNAAEGLFLPVIVDYVLATGTTATNIVAVK
jgi:hypothetical protein